MYRLFIFLYGFGIRLAALWNSKAERWVNGRKNWLATLQQQFRGEKRPVAWFHCASLGEFEQGRPLIDQVKVKFPGVCILLTFFSPSGYDACQGYEGADHIAYLPMDSPGNARDFIDTVKPTLVLFVKYEFWFHYLDTLHKRKIPLLLVSAIFRRDQPFFRWYGRFWRRMLDDFSFFFVQDRSSYVLLKRLGLHQKAMISGDTRFDRVLEIAETNTGIAAAKAFVRQEPVIVAGSTWNEDEKELVHFIRTHPNIRFIIAPHEISKTHLRYALQTFPQSILYSEYNSAFTAPGDLAGPLPAPRSARCLIIDNIGMLSSLYQYATIAYVGGGFGGDGVHNVLEAAVWGKPVVFGPIYDKYREAVDLLKAGGAMAASSTLDLEQCLRQLLDNPEQSHKAGIAARNYVEQKAGATGRIIDYIQENRLLTN